MSSASRIRMPYRVPYADTDQMGVVYYANFYVYFERCRNEVLREAGYTYKQMEAEGLMLPVVESHCRHIKPALYDDLLEIEGWFEPERRTQIRARCRVLRGEDILAEGYTIHACMDATSKRPKRIPETMLSFLTSPDDVDAT